MQSLEKLTYKDLDLNLKKLKGSENVTVADIILYLSELDKRKAYRDLGFSSLFTYCTEGLRYAAGSAYRRVEAARLMQLNPEIYDLLKSGKVNLSSISEVNKIPSNSNKLTLLVKTEGKTNEEVKVMVAKYLPPAKPLKEKIKVRAVEAASSGDLFSQEEPLAQNKVSYNFQLEVDEEFMRLYKEMKEVYGHVPASEVFRRSMKECIGRRKTIKRKVEVKVSNETRFIPKATRLKVIERDRRQCTFVSKDGRRCTERHALQFDHVNPYAKGGDNSTENLRLLCKAHNLLEAERSFGKEAIQQYL